MSVLAACLATVLRVAVIDTGLDLNDPRFQDVLCPSGHKDFTHTTINDSHGHGTHVTGLIKLWAGKQSIGHYCIVVYKYFNFQETPDTVKNMMSAIKNAKGYDIVNISGGGSGFKNIEYNAIRSNPLTAYIVAAGNEGQNLNYFPYYPAAYNLTNIIVVGNVIKPGDRAASSNYGLSGMVWEMGVKVLSTVPGGIGMLSGTSQATAIHTGKYIRKLLGIMN